MRLASYIGRATIVVDDRAIDVHRASDGVLSADPMTMSDLSVHPALRALATSVTASDCPILEPAQLGPPVPRPTKGFGVALNYRQHALESGRPLPTEPHLFGKSQNCVIGPFDEIVVPVGCTHVDYEAELVIVFGRTCKHATLDDFMIFGEVLSEAIRRSAKRVVILASGGLSHKFWPLREIREHEGAAVRHIISAEHRAADEQIIRQLAAGDHAAVLRNYPNFRRFSPEGRFAHYLIMAAAMGGPAWKSPGEAYSEYESAAGTGQIHMWFPCD